METKKLTCCDIMVWDYMLYKDGTIVKIARVGDVSPMDAPIYCHTQLEGYFPCQLADISPIPLTTEILEKNNFEKHYDDDIIIYTHPQGIIIEMGINYKFFDDGHFFVRGIQHRLFYVHEIQHALRLCGINDKEIVL